MTKSKYIMMFLFVIVMILIPATMVNADEDTFTYGEGENQITVKKVVTGYTNGDIDLDISNIVLSNEGNYVWAAEKTKSTSDSTKWYNLGDFNTTKKTAKVTLTTSNDDMLALLRGTDTAYLYIKDTKGTDKDASDDEIIINGLQLDLTLPPLYAFQYNREFRS